MSIYKSLRIEFFYTQSVSDENESRCLCKRGWQQRKKLYSEAFGFEKKEKGFAAGIVLETEKGSKQHRILLTESYCRFTE